jgi:hypothetical protein
VQVLTKRSSKPKRGQEKEALRTARKVLVADLKIGMKIPTRFHKTTPELLRTHMPKGLSEGQQAAWLFDAMQYEFVAKSMLVKEIEECPGKWRTHIHVNKKDCYDVRQTVWVVNE